MGARPLVVLIVAATAAIGASAVPSSAAARGCGPAADSNPGTLAPKQARAAVLCLIGRERAQAGVGRLDDDHRLQHAAQRHTRRMDGTGCFDHACAGESDLGRRLTGTGYLRGGLTRWAYAENIAWGSGSRGSPRSIVAAWMGSPEHRANILSRSYRDIGVGFAPGDPHSRGADAGIYTLDFGLRVG